MTKDYECSALTKSHKTLWIVLLIVALLLIAALLAYFFLVHNKNNDRVRIDDHYGKVPDSQRQIVPVHNN